MISFPQTTTTRFIEAEVVEKLKGYTPKNEEVGAKKVVEFLKAARDKVESSKDLKAEFKEVTVSENSADENWLGFSYYYCLTENEIAVGLFQLDTRYWKKEAVVEEPKPEEQ